MAKFYPFPWLASENKTLIDLDKVAYVETYKGEGDFPYGIRFVFHGIAAAGAGAGAGGGGDGYEYKFRTQEYTQTLARVWKDKKRRDEEFAILQSKLHREDRLVELVPKEARGGENST